MIHLGNS